MRKAGTFKYGAEEALQNHEGHGKSEHKTVFHQILQLENYVALVETLVGN